MAITRIHSAAIIGLAVREVSIEVDLVETHDKSHFVIVGLPDSAVRESKDRVTSAMRNSQLYKPNMSCTINLAPGDLKKEGSFYDLPIALGLSHALNKKSEDIPYLIVGELGLGGELRAVSGALALATYAKDKGLGIILPYANAKEASLVKNLDIIAVRTLKEAWEFLQNPRHSPYLYSQIECAKTSVTYSLDFADIKGQYATKRALEIAAAGAHNLVMCGPPGAGKTLLAKAFSSILPSLSTEESLEVTKIHSIAKCMPKECFLIQERPFRSPHHTISHIGLIGGGSNPRPGEVSLAHLGVLFLDELPEFTRLALEVLRQPLEDGKVTITRAMGSFSFPTQFMLLGAMNPCPCGYLGHPTKPCKDTPQQVEKYRSKISGPLWDRIDMHITVNALKKEELLKNTLEEASSCVRARVERARNIQIKRFGFSKTNSLISINELKKFCLLDERATLLMEQALEKMHISARSFNRILKVARTIADLSEEETLSEEHILEALNFRQD